MIRYRKVLRDLTSNAARTTMLIAAIAIGLLALGVILGAYTVIKREMKANYMATVPASATLEVEDSIPLSVLAYARTFPGVRDAERHATIVARMKVQERWYPLLLFVIDDFRDMRTNKFSHVSGASVPDVRHMLVEQTAYGVMQAGEGSNLVIRLANTELNVKLSGTVHDPSLAPAWQEQAGYGYITLSTLRLLAPDAALNELRIVTAREPQLRENIVETARALSASLASKGVHVHEIQVPPPGKHPHEGQMSTVMTMFVIFSILVVILACILVATSMETIMVKEIRQIGVMKSIGAKEGQIVLLYGSLIVVLGVVACAVAIPTGRIGASIFSRQLAGLLNIVIHDDTIPIWTVLLQVSAGILLPLAVAAVPVLRGSRITVKNALTNYGVQLPPNQEHSRISRWLALARANQTLQLAQRNIFRQRARLTMTIGLLAAAGAMYMTAKNVSRAWDKNLQRVYDQKKYDLDVRFEILSDTLGVARTLEKLPGVRHLEFWALWPTTTKTNNDLSVSRTYPDKGHGSFSIAGLPVGTKMIAPCLQEGTWLSEARGNDVVLNQLAVAQIPDASIGKEILLSVEGKTTRWRVIGFTEDVGTPATAYVSLEALVIQANTGINTLRIGYADRSQGKAILNNAAVEEKLQKLQLPITSTIPVWVLRNAVAAHMKILVDALLALALLMAVVGTLALISTMSISVLERTREIGVMRAIGATPDRIRRIIASESALIGLFSLLGALPISLALSAYLSYLVGALSFRTPLSLTVSYTALAEWTGLLFVVGILATVVPSRRASKITTREALAFE
jgi:putative ABC transport system permease protein